MGNLLKLYLSNFCSSLDGILTHTIDTLQHQSLSLRSSALYHSTTSAPYIYIFRRICIYIYIYVWKLNQTVLVLDFKAVIFLLFPLRDLNSHHWYTAAPFVHKGVDVVEWSRALDVRLSEWRYSVSMVWVQIPSREEQKFDSSKI